MSSDSLYPAYGYLTLVPANDQTDCVVSDVTFEPGARNNWHTHGQILVATAGTGYYQEKGKPIQLLRVGEGVNIAPGVVHWHGATSDSRFYPHRYQSKREQRRNRNLGTTRDGYRIRLS